MLAIRLQRTGRKGHAQFRVVVQESRLSPSSGKVVAQLGSYNPHTKESNLEKEKAEFYLTHGAHPSDRVARLLKSEGVKLPKWVELEGKKEGKIRNPEKLRRNRLADTEAVADKPAEAPTEQPAETAEEPVAATPEEPETEASPELAEEVADQPAEAYEASESKDQTDNA